MQVRNREMIQQFISPPQKKSTKEHKNSQRFIFEKNCTKKMVQSLGKAHKIETQNHKSTGM